MLGKVGSRPEPRRGGTGSHTNSEVLGRDDKRQRSLKALVGMTMLRSESESRRANGEWRIAATPDYTESINCKELLMATTLETPAIMENISIHPPKRLLRKVFGTTNELTFVISATGSGGMETAISNFVQQGTKVVSFANGFFCDRMSEMARRQGTELVRFEKPWGEVFGDDE